MSHCDNCNLFRVKRSKKVDFAKKESKRSICAQINAFNGQTDNCIWWNGKKWFYQMCYIYVCMCVCLYVYSLVATRKMHESLDCKLSLSVPFCCSSPSLQLHCCNKETLQPFFQIFYDFAFLSVFMCVWLLVYSWVFISIDTYIDDIILGIVCICAANVKPVTVFHWLYDTNVILAIENLK